MSEIMCKCGHPASRHDDDKDCNMGCFHTEKTKRCECEFSEQEVEKMQHIFNEIAKLEAENKKLVEEKEKLKNSLVELLTIFFAVKLQEMGKKDDI